jgi:hypothetical protein
LREPPLPARGPPEGRPPIVSGYGRVVVPADGDVRGVVYIHIRDDGTRDADVALLVDDRWQYYVPLSAVEGDEAFAEASAWAHRFLARQAVKV